MEDEINETKRKAIKGLIIGISLTLGLFILFYWGIPVNIYHSSPSFFAVVGCISLTAAAVYGTASVVVLLNPNPSDDKGKNSAEGCLTLLAIMVTLFGSGMLFIYHEVQLEEKELLTYGEITKAYIADGSSFSTRRIDLTTVTLKFIKKDGEEFMVNHSISKSEFQQYYEGENLLIVYSTRYPTIMQILHTPEEVEKYSQSKPRRTL